MSIIDKAEFWEQHQRFLKEPLVTEQPNIATYNLSELCKTDMLNAYSTFLKVELAAIEKLYQYASDIAKLRNAIYNTLKHQHKIFILGCGASGRLAILLKRICEINSPQLMRRIVAINSAGDTSLIRAVEQFEDKETFGIRQLVELGYNNNDLVIGLSASGESPFILGAIAHAVQYSPNNSPWLIYNNPTYILISRNEKHILNHFNINKIALNIGPMALTGSTRLQATTAMLISIGLALNPAYIIEDTISNIINTLTDYPFQRLVPLTILESNIFSQHQYILYQTNDNLLGLNLLADLTERAPTFNLTPFENLNSEMKPPYSPFYLSLINQADNHSAWHYLLGQNPVCLNWQDFPQTHNGYIYGFEISQQSNRTQYLDNIQSEFQWLIKNDTLNLSLQDQHIVLPLTSDLLVDSLIYKIALNMHSTLMFGRLDYFMGNLMISLKPSNFKLIDRAIRYCLFILDRKYHIKPSYKNVADILFKELPNLEANESIVLKVIAQFVV